MSSRTLLKKAIRSLLFPGIITATSHVFDTLIRDQAGNPLGLVGISFDLTICQ
jgi:hypothetical protein